MSGILYNQVMCEFEVFHTFDTDLPSDHGDYQHDSVKKQEYDLSGFKRISPTPKFTLSYLYVSPESAEPHFTRSVSKGGTGDGYNAFLQTHFHGNNGDDEVNSEYRQKSYDEDDDADDDVEVNSEYRETNDDGDDDNDDEVNSSYQHAPEVVEENDDHHHSYNGNDGNGFDRIQSSPQKKTKHSAKNCKIIVKGEAMCKLCKDPVSGAHSESCSFSSSPPEHKYAYIKKEKYIS